MTKKTLHIVSFDVPAPPNYGGVIDVFYKIKSLHKLGVSIILHTFEYGRNKQPELKKYCKKVLYYKRNSILPSILSKTPFIVKSRANQRLIENLKSIKAPILFEGLHTTYPLQDHIFQNQLVAVRIHNIEHRYYNGLYNSESNLAKKAFFKAEAIKLKQYEKIVNKSDYIFTLAPFEQKYFEQKYATQSIYLPVFHDTNKVSLLSEQGAFAFFHGDFRVADNVRAVKFLIQIFSAIDYPLKLASSFSNSEINRLISSHPHISYVKIDNQTKLNTLFEEAHLNVLPTFQKTGIKLKLINTLYKSRFCIVNSKMIENTGLEKLCCLANTMDEFKAQIKNLISKKYSTEDVEIKNKILSNFDTNKSAQLIVDKLF